MSRLTPDDFAAFHEEVHGYAPFPWQDRLLRQLLRERRFPDLVDIPTGVGKTTLMDIALFALAVEAERPSEQRWIPRRIFLVVDRRVIVDQAGERALMLARLLEDARTGILPSPIIVRVSEALSSLSGGGEALVPAILRGGTLRDDNWARRPDQPVLGASTVDQVGSRLLFSGYGVRGLAASIHAGLLGRDTLFLLDEVHLSRPFRDTLRAVRKYSGPEWAESATGVANQFVELSATPEGERGETDRVAFRLGEDDRKHPLIRQRLAASKPVRLLETSSGTQRTFVSTFVKEARQMVQKHRTVAVVVNRVASARDICASLADDAERRGFDVHLVTGRMRPLDRQDLLDRVGPRIAAGRHRSGQDRPLVLVATQSIEAGADLDFDALVTECASLDALKQRFGRVDRLGRYGQAEGLIIARKTDISPSGGDDPVYGDALRETWRWLQQELEAVGEEGRIDFGLDALASMTPSAGVSSPTHSAPVMLPAHLDAWAQTGPAPALQPDVSLWLHGPEDRARDVQIAWRADLSAEELDAAAEPMGSARDGQALAGLIDRLSFAPPASPEILAVPLVAARAWLSSAGRTETQVSDVEGARQVTGRPEGTIRPVIVWDGDRSRLVTDPRELRPGITLVVPCSYGGLGMGTWDPSSDEPVTDLGDRAQLVARGRVSLRMHPSLIRNAGQVAPPRPGADETRSRSDELADVVAWLDAVAKADGTEPWLELVYRELGADGDRGRILRVFESDRGTPTPDRWWGVALRKRRAVGVLQTLRQRERTEAHTSAGPDQLDLIGGAPRPESGLEHFVEDFDGVENSSFVAKEVTLDDHLEAVAAKVGEFARNLGLSAELQETLWWAGRLHDVGKADRRFQLWLHGGDEIELAATGRLLAKSPLPAQDRVARRAAKELAGYPHGLRHEMASASMVARAEALLQRVPDPDLLLHLIASHHGWGRAFAPPITDPEPTQVRYQPPHDDLPELHASSDETLATMDSGVTERFWRLTRRFGWHGLAHLEALLRLADHRVSEEEENG